MPRKIYRLTIWKEAPDGVRHNLVKTSVTRAGLCRQAALLHWSHSPDLAAPDYHWWYQFENRASALTYTNRSRTFELRLEVCGTDATECGENTTPRPIDTDPVSCDNATS